MPSYFTVMMPELSEHVMPLKPYLQKENRYGKKMSLVRNLYYASTEARESLFAQGDISVVFFNRSMLARLSVSFGKDPSWDELTVMLAELTERGGSYIRSVLVDAGIGKDWRYLVTNMDRVAGSGREGIAWCLSTVGTIRDTGIRITTNSENPEWNTHKLFKDDATPIYMGNLSQVRDMPLSVDWVVTHVPSGPAGRAPAFYITKEWVLIDHSNHGQEGWNALVWLTVGEGATISATYNPTAVTVPLLSGEIAVPIALQERWVGDIIKSIKLPMPKSNLQLFPERLQVVDSFIKQEITLMEALGKIEQIKPKQ